MDQEQRRVAKAQLVAGMQAGYSWQQAAARAGVQTSQSNAYRLWLAVRKHGEKALSDGRHGHPIKLRGEARTFLEEQSHQAPCTPRSTLQTALRERFGLRVGTAPHGGGQFGQLSHSLDSRGDSPYPSLII
jgi:transposase